MAGKRPKLQGSYKNSEEPGYLKVEEDGKVTYREGGRETLENVRIEYGKFKQAEDVLREASGIENYNLKLMTFDEKNGKEEWSQLGIVADDGERLYWLDDYGAGVDICPKITEEKAAEIGWCWVKSQPQLTVCLVQTRTRETPSQPPQVPTPSSRTSGGNSSG